MDPIATLQTAVGNGGLARPEWLPDPIPTVLFRLAVVVVILAVAYYASRLLRQLLARRIARQFERPSISRTVLRLLQGSILALGVLSAFGVFGLGIGNVVLSVGVFSAVVGIILAPIIGSVISGVFILTEQPYEIGDMIEIEDTDTRGFVEEITLLYTKIFTLENTFIVLPNGTMRERDIINYSAEDTRIRLTLDVDVTYESDVEEARELLEAAARNVDAVISGGPDIRIGSARYPASPTCYVREFGDHGVGLRLRYWAREPYRMTTIRSEVQTNAWERIADANVEIPYPHSHLVFDETSGEMRVGVRDADGDVPEMGGSATGRPPDAEDIESEPIEGDAGTVPDGVGDDVGDGAGDEAE